MNKKKPEFFYNFGIFIVKMLMKLGICLSRLHGTRWSLKRLVVFLDILFPTHVHFMLDFIMLLCGVTCVILLYIMFVYCPYYECCAHFNSSLPLTQSMRV